MRNDLAEIGRIRRIEAACLLSGNLAGADDVDRNAARLALGGGHPKQRHDDCPFARDAALSLNHE